MFLIFFEILISITYAKRGSSDRPTIYIHSKTRNQKKILSECPSQPLSDKQTVILTSKTEIEYTHKSIYGCQQTFLSKQLKLTNCVLSIYNSNFTNSNSDKNAIYFNSNTFSDQLEGNIEIKGCQFINYKS